eukprot:6197860-Pleurochrysis_carterae.AAC.1
MPPPRKPAKAKAAITAHWQSVENYAVSLAATEASDRAQREKVEMIELYTMQHYKLHFEKCVDEFGFIESVTSDKVLADTKRTVNTCLQNGNIFARWNKEVWKYTNNIINPIYIGLLNDNCRIPSGMTCADIDSSVREGIWQNTIVEKEKTATACKTKAQALAPELDAEEESDINNDTEIRTVCPQETRRLA